LPQLSPRNNFGGKVGSAAAARQAARVHANTRAPPQALNRVRESDEYVTSGIGNVRSNVQREVLRLQDEAAAYAVTDEARLALYRESFERFVGKFTKYEGLLSAVKRQYDQVVLTAGRRLFDLQPKVLRHASLTSDYDLDLQMIHHNHERETAKEQRRLEKWQRQIRETGLRAEKTRERRAEVRQAGSNTPCLRNRLFANRDHLSSERAII
jgi:hypothetical protein